MSLKRKIITAVISAFALVTFTTFVSAQNSNTNTQEQDSANQQQREKRDRRGGKRNGMGRGQRGGDIMRVLERLNLTDTQKQQVRTILEANRPNPSEFEEVKGLMEAKRNGTITAEQTEKLKAFHEQMKQKHEQVKTQILAVLTDEQRTEYEKIKAEMKQRREERQKERQERKNQQNQQTEKKDN